MFLDFLCYVFAHKDRVFALTLYGVRYKNAKKMGRNRYLGITSASKLKQSNYGIIKNCII